MPKISFTTRLDADVRALAEAAAKAERRSVTQLIEVAVIEYCRARGYAVPTKTPKGDA